jgi:hypothetical protein
MNYAGNGLKVPTHLPPPTPIAERGLIIEYKRVLFQMDEDLEKVIGIVKEYQARYGELE